MIPAPHYPFSPVNAKPLWEFAQQRMREAFIQDDITFAEARDIIIECLPAADPVLADPSDFRRDVMRQQIDRLATLVLMQVLISTGVDPAKIKLAIKINREGHPWD
jgi:hypothetical protein